VDYQEPLLRKNGWRYTGPDGRPYRQQVAFEKFAPLVRDTWQLDHCYAIGVVSW
jgi:hypothetical protein